MCNDAACSSSLVNVKHMNRYSTVAPLIFVSHVARSFASAIYNAYTYLTCMEKLCGAHEEAFWHKCLPCIYLKIFKKDCRVIGVVMEIQPPLQSTCCWWLPRGKGWTIMHTIVGLISRGIQSPSGKTKLLLLKCHCTHCQTFITDAI